MPLRTLLGLGCLRASTLIEAIVASIIFLGVFALSLETVTRLVTGGDDDRLESMAAQSRMAECRGNCERGPVSPEQLFRVYGNDTVTIEAERYTLCDSLLQITLSTPAGAGRKVRITFLQSHRPNDEEP